MPDYAFHGEGMEPRRIGIVLVPIRRLLRRVQKPWFERQVEIFNELRAAADQAEARLAGAEARLESAEARLGVLKYELEELRTSLREDEARSWDQGAIAGRLAALEDAVAERSPATRAQAGAGPPG